MKAHIHQDPRALLLWGITPETPGCDELLRRSAAFRLNPRFVGAADFDTTIGDLCAGKASVLVQNLPDPLPLADTRAMIVGGLRHDNGDLNAWLDAVKKTGLTFPVRAAVTPTSAAWTLGHLLEELSAEHAALGASQAEQAQ